MIFCDLHHSSPTEYDFSCVEDEINRMDNGYVRSNKFLRSIVKDLVDDITDSEGCATGLSSIYKCYRINYVMDIITNNNGNEKWKLFFDTLKSLNLSDDDKYYFRFCFRTFRLLGIIDEEEKSQLLERYCREV